MKKTILINEQQRRVILVESVVNKIDKVLESNYELVKKILNSSSRQTKLDFQFLLTWGATIGGLMGPLNSFINGMDVKLSDDDVCLILTGIILTYYYDHKDKIQKVKNIIKEKGLMDVFNKVKDKTIDLKNAFSNFISSLALTSQKVTNIAAYTFLIPLIPILINVFHKDFSPNDINEIVKRLLSFGVLTVSGNAIRELMMKLSKKIKQ